MKKILKFTIILFLVNAVLSCSYDYNMPDYPTEPLEYEVTIPNGNVIKQIIEDIKKYDLDLTSSDINLRPIVKEIDDLGNVVYEGEPRNVIDKKAKTIEISYLCSCKLQCGADYDICQIDYHRQFELFFSPTPCVVTINENDDYSLILAEEIPVSYNVDNNLNTFEKANELGCNITNIQMIVTEKDDDGNIICSFEHQSKNGNIITLGKTIDVEIALFGKKNNSSTKEYVGSYYFKDIEVEDIKGTTLSLTEKIQHKFIKSYSYNIDSDVPSIEKVTSYGYNLLGIQTIITEKESDGSVIKTFEHRVIDGEIKTRLSEYIDVEIALYGQPTNSAGKVYVGSYIFKDIKLEGIDGTTLVLTENMNHEFIENPDMPYYYNIDRNLPVIEKINSYGYTVADVTTSITEKDENGKAIRTFGHRAIDGMIYSMVGAKTIDVEVSLYGFNENNDKIYVGSYIFKDIKLEDINGTTLTLTEDMEHEFVENEKMPYSYNINRDDLPVVEKINSYGYSVADVNMIITEKDGNGNDIRVFEHRTIDGMISTEAKTIDVEIALYGYTSNYDKVYIGSYIFKDIHLAKINGTTLTLTEDMEHEFVENPDL